MSAAASDILRPLDAATRDVVKASFNQALAEGWTQGGLTAFLVGRGVSKEQYDAAVKRGEAVSDSVFAALSAISARGIASPSQADILRQLEWLVEPARGAYDDALIEVAWGDCNRAKLFGLDELEGAAQFAAAKNLAGLNCYVGAALKLPDTPRDGRSNASHYYVATAVPIDIDADYDRVRMRMAAACDDGLVVTTGLTPERRSQHWARLVEPSDDGLEFEHAFTALVNHTGADPKVHDRARLMRLGGTVNFPTPAKIARGYITELTVVTIKPAAKCVDIDTFQALDPLARPGEKFDASNRPKAKGIVREGILGTGRVSDGRETWFCDILLEQLRIYQQTNGADPSPDDLWDAAWLQFSDPEETNNEDGRWTSGEGLQMLQKRVPHTLRRLRNGHLARWGLYSRETEAGREQAEQVQANREATRKPVYAAGVETPPWGDEAAAEAAEPPPESGQATDDDDAPEDAGTREEAPDDGAAGGADDKGDAQPTIIFDPWQRWLTPTFPLDTLPPVIRAHVEAQSASTGADVSACAMSALAACSGALSHAFSLKMKRTGAWKASPRLWVMLVGSSSAKKSPVINGATAPLKERDAAEAKAHAKEHARWKAAKEAGDKNAAPPPPSLQFIANSTTAEMLGETLSHQDRGLLVERDELAGWFGEMEKYSGGKGGAANRAFWLQAYNGGPLRNDTISRGKTFIENCSVSLLGGIQPGKLEELGNLSSDGMLQRFLPVMMRRSERPAEVDDAKATADYAELVRYLTHVRPAPIFMDDAALEVARAFQGFTYDMEMVEGLGEGFCSFLGKLNGVHGSLMLLLHMLRDPSEGPYSPVSARTAGDAARILREFAIPHALALYRESADGVDWDYLRSLASFVLTSDRDRFTVSDFTSGVHSLRGQGVWEVGQKVSPLVAGGWLEEEESRSVVKAWKVIPGLREVLAERRQEEANRKAETMRAYRDLRG
jgi:hypothetical protein